MYSTLLGYALLVMEMNVFLKVQTYIYIFFLYADGCEGEVCEEDEEVEEEPEVECVRGVTGDVHHPAFECYGAVTITILGWQGRWLVSVFLFSLILCIL